MKANYFFILFSILFFQSNFVLGAVDIQVNEVEEKKLNESNLGQNFQDKNYRKNSKSFFSKKKKLRLRELFKRKKKKNKKIQDSSSKQEVPLVTSLSAMLAAIITVGVLSLILVSRYFSITLPFLVIPLIAFGSVASFILGIIGLWKYKSDKERYGKETKALSWAGILVSTVWITLIILLFAVILL